MATTATLTAIAPTPSSTDNTKRKTEDNLGAISNRKPAHRRLPSATTSSMDVKTPMDLENPESLNKTNALTRTTPTFRIPKLGRPTPDSVSSSPTSDQSESSSTVSSKMNSNFHRHTSDDVNSQQGKRKFSLSQYKERKRLKSDELQQTNLTDTDMRINSIGPIKNSPPTPMDDEPSNSIDNVSMISPKSAEISKDIVMKSNLSEPGVRKVIKKKVIWADEKNQSLVQTSFFEVDDSELSEMHIFARNGVANIPIAQLEKVMERDLRKRRGIQDINAIDNDDKQFSTPLPALIKIVLPDSIQTPQIVSQERFVQEEREKTVLQALFIPAFLPDSPGEPDGDLPTTNNSERNEPKLIPLDDDTGSCVSSKVTPLNNNLNTVASLNATTVATTNTSSTPTINLPLVATTNSPNTIASSVTPSLSSFAFGDVSPEVAHILAQAKGNLSSATANQSSTTSNTVNPSTTTTLAPNSLLTSTTTPNLSGVPNLAAPANFLTSLFNVSRTSNNDSSSSTVPSNNLLANLLPNLSMTFNLPPPPPAPANFPLGQLLVNALSLGLSLPTANATLFPTSTTTTNTSSTFTAPPTNLPNPIANTVTPPPANTKPPSVRFVSAMGQQNRSNMTNSNEHQLSSSRENSREQHFRRGPPNNHHHHHHHHHHHNRRGDYYPNRHQQQQQQQQQNNNNNNNRNLHP